MEKIKRLADWWKRTRVARGLSRYSTANGKLLSGGISFSGLFSIFAALAIGFTVFMAVLGQNVELRNAVLDAVNDALPGVVDTGDGQGMLSPEDLQLTTAGGIVGAIAVVVLLNTARGVMTSLRRGVRAMFGIVSPKENPVLGVLRDLAGFAVLALALLLTAALGIAAGTMATWLLDLIGLADSPVAGVLLRVATLLVALIIDTLVFIFILRGLAGVRPPRRDLIIGSAIGAIGAGVLRLGGTALVGGVVDNPLLASYAAIITLLLWVNLWVRIVLLVGSWVANPPPKLDVTDDMLTHFSDSPNYVTVSEPRTLTWDFDPITGQIRPIRPEPEPQAEEQPYWGGMIGWMRDRVRTAQEEQQRDPEAEAEEAASRYSAPKDPSDPGAGRPVGSGGRRAGSRQ